jgi:nucleotide-binding universal stress UspA family protein
MMSLADAPKNLSDPAKFVVHLTDLSPSSEAAFVHAVRIALTFRADLTVLYVGNGEEVDWDAFPSFREILQRWGFLEQGASRADVAKLGLKVNKIAVTGKSVAKELAEYCDQFTVDLLVVATEQQGRLAEWLHSNTPAAAARRAGLPALFVPTKGRGCVSAESGEVSIHQVLVPVNHEPRADEAVERGLRIITASGNRQAQLTLLHIGSETNFPKVEVPEGPWQVVRTVRKGDAAAEIVEAANECNADLLVMVTAGNDGLLDGLRGSTTQQVLRNSPCPVLAVPAHF